MAFSEIFRKYRFSGGRNSRFSDQPEKEIVLDYSEPNERKMALSLDCYVSGQYVDKKGNSVEVKFRFNVYVRYSASTMQNAMSGLRGRLMEEFKREFPGFEPTTVFVEPDKWRVPVAPTAAQEVGFYEGGELYKKLTGMQIARYEIATRKDIYDSSVSMIKKRYGLR
jgi:hypothetical protein